MKIKNACDKKLFIIIKKNEFWTRYVQATSYNTNITAVSNKLISLKRRIVMNKIKNTLVILIALIVSMNMTVVTKAYPLRMSDFIKIMYTKPTVTDSIRYKSDTYLQTMLMYGKEASNRKQEIDRQHYTIPNQRPKDKHCGKI